MVIQRRIALIEVMMILLCLGTHTIFGQSKTELAQMIVSCENDLDSCRLLLKKSQASLEASQSLYDKRIAVSDSLAFSLRAQLSLQDSITHLLKANADTLEVMVNDYNKKLMEVDKLYSKTLQIQSRPWLFTSKGFQGLLYGIVVGGLAAAIVMYTN